MTPDLPGQQAWATRFRKGIARKGNASLLSPIYFQLPVLVAGAERATSPQRARRQSVPIWTAAMWALVAVLGVSPCSWVLREAELMGTWGVRLGLPVHSKQVDALVFGGWNVLVP